MRRREDCPRHGWNTPAHKPGDDSRTLRSLMFPEHQRNRKGWNR